MWIYDEACTRSFPGVAQEGEIGGGGARPSKENKEEIKPRVWRAKRQGRRGRGKKSSLQRSQDLKQRSRGKEAYPDRGGERRERQEGKKENGREEDERKKDRQGNNTVTAIPSLPEGVPA